MEEENGRPEIFRSGVLQLQSKYSEVVGMSIAMEGGRAVSIKNFCRAPPRLG